MSGVVSARPFFVFADDMDNDTAVVTAYPEGPERWEFTEGIPLSQKMEDKATVRFSERYRGRQLNDFQANTLSLVLASGRARKVIESLGIGGVEFLPVTVLDHRGKVAADDYAIVNLLGSQPAIDMKASTYDFGHMNPTAIGFLKHMVLDRAAIPEDAQMFRCAHMMETVLIRGDVKAAFEAAELTGYVTYDADGWNGVAI